MSFNKIVSKVFGEPIFSESFDTQTQKSSTSKGGIEPNLTDHIVKLKLWLKDTMKNIEETCKDFVLLQESLMVSRLGSDKVIFDIDINSTIRISNDRLTIRSQGSFNTIKANACIFGGKWMYEVQLHTKGVMQIGWCSSECEFNENSGVGDTVYSYGYDGSKQQKWHMSTNKYGEKWQTGDIIGVCINVDKGHIEYFRNGVALGIAFENISKGPGITFFPAVSLGYSEGLKANFGNSPLRFPIPGYNPLQAKPINKLEKSELLLRFIVNLSEIISRSKYREKDTKQNGEKYSTKKTVHVLIASILFEQLAENLLEVYVIEEILIPYIMNLCVVRTDTDKGTVILPGSAKSTLGTLLSMLWNHLEWGEMKFVLNKLINGLLSKYSETGKGLENDSQRNVIVVLNCICTHKVTRKFCLKNKFFKKHCLALLMNLRPPNYATMINILPDEVVWTKGIGGSKEKYLTSAERLAKNVDTLYLEQVKLFKLLLTNIDGDSSFPSSRKLFINKLRRYVIDANMEQRPLQSLFLMQTSIHHPIESPVALSFCCILIDAISQLLKTEKPGQPVSIDPILFIDGTFQYQHFDRIGGVLSHLYKVYRNDMVQVLGTDRVTSLNQREANSFRTGDIEGSILFTPANLNNISILGRTQVSTTSTISQHHLLRQKLEDPEPGNASTIQSLYELLDIATLYYYSVGHKYIVKIASVRDELAVLNDVIIEARKNREDVEKQLNQATGDNLNVVCNDILTDLSELFTQRLNAFTKRSLELSRKQAWYRSVDLGKRRRHLLLWLLNTTLNTLKKSSEMGVLFAFVPEVYVNVLPILLDTVLDFSFHDLSLQFDLSDAKEEITAAAAFLGEHSADQRILLASCKNALLQALGTLICHEEGIRALETSPNKSKDAFIQTLLRPYENRAWGQSNWILLRLWLGEGFAYKDSRHPSIWQGGNDALTMGLYRSRAKSETDTGLLHHIAPVRPSKYFQQRIGMCLIENEQYATAFLNSVLSQLNWAFSEFILLLQEIQNTSNRQENTVPDSKQLTICSMCFELTVSLMRCLEMVISIAPDIVQDSSRANSDLILNRICQLISQVLSRVTIPPGCFQFIVDMCSIDLNSVTHFAIITAAIGVLLALMKNEMEKDEKPAKITRVTRYLLTDPSFQIANLEFAIGEINAPSFQQTETPRGNFNDIRITTPSMSKNQIRVDPPIIKFSLYEYPTHVTEEEIGKVKRLIEILRIKQSLLSDITLPSEDSLCPICCAKPIGAIFNPCKHQSCCNCILQHLMSSKLCFYCKTFIEAIENGEGQLIYGPIPSVSAE